MIAVCRFLLCAAAMVAGLNIWRAEATEPTLAQVPYGSSPEQVLDFWKANGDVPAPCVFFIHSGAWLSGDRREVGFMGCDEFLAAGISVVSIEFRTVTAASQAGVQPPLRWPMEDAARALQFVRTKAAVWGIDGKRIGAEGRSSGGTTALWLALHEEMAKPESMDPVERESTRVQCVGVVDAQTTLDPAQMREWIPNASYGGHAFGFFREGNPTGDFETFLAARDRIQPWIREYSPAALVSASAPPVYLHYGGVPAPAGKGQVDPIHTAVFGLKLKELLTAAKVKVEPQVRYPGVTTADFDQIEFLIRMLRGR